MTDGASNSEIRRILIVRLGAMGDVIHALPAVVAIHAVFPRAEIGWVIERRWAELLRSPFLSQTPALSVTAQDAPATERSPQQPLVDKLHLVDTFSWRAQPLSVKTRDEAMAVLRELRKLRYDVAVDFQGAWKSAFLARLSGAPVRIGFRQPRESGATVFYNRPVMARGVHVVEQNLSLLSGFKPLENNQSNGKLDAILQAPPPAPLLPNDSSDNDNHDRTRVSWTQLELERRGLAGQEFAVINPGAGWGAKCWPAERYAEVVRALAGVGLRSLINFGPGEETLAHAVETASQGAAQAARYTIGELVALMRRARLFVGGDTGPMHLAAALHVPVVAIFGPTDPARNGPYAAESIVLRNAASITDHSRGRASDAGLLSITAAEVIEAAGMLLARTRGPAAHRTGEASIG